MRITLYKTVPNICTNLLINQDLHVNTVVNVNVMISMSSASHFSGLDCEGVSLVRYSIRFVGVHCQTSLSFLRWESNRS